jgi:hypothetical protein
MGLILLPPGSAYQFIDGQDSIPQYAGTHDAFNRIILNEFTVSSSATATIQQNATLTINGILNQSGVVKHDYTRINPNSIPTSSLGSPAEFAVTGSFISSIGTANHMISLGTPTALYDYTVNYIKASTDTTNLVMIRSTAGISGQTQWSSSDAWASIQVVCVNGQSTLEWVITSKVGNWY